VPVTTAQRPESFIQDEQHTGRETRTNHERFAIARRSASDMARRHAHRHSRQEPRAAFPTIRVFAVISALAIVVTAAVAGGAQEKAAPFAWLRPTSVPAGWDRVTTADGRVVLSYPPTFRIVHSDPGSVSVALGPGPKYRAYLNVTPRQGHETVSNFAAFRVNHIGEDHDMHVHRDGSIQGLPLGQNRASAVLDDYVTRAGGSHYREFAILVESGRGGWVVVGAAINSAFPRYRPLLEQAIAAFALL
jgi:hypothetical protein